MMKDEMRGARDESIVEYALMPWDDETEIMPEHNSFFDKPVTSWNLIKMQLGQNKRIVNVYELIDTIRSYSIVQYGPSKQLKSPWKFSALQQYFEGINETEKYEFFKEGGILGTIRNLVLQAPELVPKVKLLKTGFRSCVSLHQLQIASLLANAFMCTYPRRDANYPSINFNMLFEGTEIGNMKPFVEKIKCIIHYFKRINETQPTANLSFHRLCIVDQKLPRWDKTTASLCELQVEIQGKIEDQEGFLQMDFANRFVGGGVLGRGCVQEEIRFIICPELIVARLFTQCLADNEALFIIGAERYCKYKGYSNSFEFDGDFQDTTPLDDTKHRKTYLIVLDALCFNHSSEQYRESKILRELKKAYVGFKPIAKTPALPLATGNWGCGAFRGDPQLKSILQLMASSQAQRDVLYLTFGDSSLKKQIDDLYKLLKERDINVGTLYRIIRLYNKNKNKNQTLFDFIRDAITDYKKRTSSGIPAISSHIWKESFQPETGNNFLYESNSLNKFTCQKDYGGYKPYCRSAEKKIKTFSTSTICKESDHQKKVEETPSFDETSSDALNSSEHERDYPSDRFNTGVINVSVTSPIRTEMKITDTTCQKSSQVSNDGNTKNQTEKIKVQIQEEENTYTFAEDDEMAEPYSPSLLSSIEENGIKCHNSGDKNNCQNNELMNINDCKGKKENDNIYEYKSPAVDYEQKMKETRSNIGQRHKIYAVPFSDVKTKTRKLIQMKITDCFSKK